jgi:hypothetical protein
LRWLRLLFPEDRRFADLLGRQADVVVRACGLLARQATPAEMARVESDGDAARRELVEALARTYATPLDRDDLFELSSALDDICDSAQDALLTLAVLGGGDFAHVQEMCLSIREGAEALRAAVARLPSPAAREPARRAKRCENVVGNLYRYGLELALRVQAPDRALRLREVLAELREVARAIGRAADLVADVTVKEQ